MMKTSGWCGLAMNRRRLWLKLPLYWQKESMMAQARFRGGRVKERWPTVRSKAPVPPAERMHQRMVQAFAEVANRHNVRILFRNGLRVSPDGTVDRPAGAKVSVESEPQAPNQGPSQMDE